MPRLFIFSALLSLLAAARGADVVTDATAAGPEGVKAWHDHVDRECTRLAAIAEGRPSDTAIDRDVAALRTTLADLLEACHDAAPGDPALATAGTKAVDSVRMLCGLAPLVIDRKLCVAATGHSADMEAHNFFAHESPLPGKKEPWDRARLAGTTAAAENISMGSPSGTDAVKAWFLSPGHHKNLLADGHVRQGLGRSGDHWTQLFGD